MNFFLESVSQGNLVTKLPKKARLKRTTHQRPSQLFQPPAPDSVLKPRLRAIPGKGTLQSRSRISSAGEPPLRAEGASAGGQRTIQRAPFPSRGIQPFLPGTGFPPGASIPRSRGPGYHFPFVSLLGDLGSFFSLFHSRRIPQPPAFSPCSSIFNTRARRATGSPMTLK